MRELAEKSCYVEIEKLNEPIGKQDQYITALGELENSHLNRMAV